MSRLNAAERAKLPADAFGLPGKRAYPEEDKAHARDAASRASAAEKEGRITEAQEEKIDRKERRVLGIRQRRKRKGRKKGETDKD